MPPSTGTTKDKDSLELEDLPFLLLLYGSAIENPLIRAAISALDKNLQFKVFESKSPNEINEQIRLFGRGLVLFDIQQEADLRGTVATLEKLEPLTRAEVVRVSGFSKIVNERVERILRSKGCSEILSNQQTPRALSMKLARWIRYLEGNAEKKQKQHESSEDWMTLDDALSKRAAKLPVEWLQPLPEGEDFWTISSEDGISFANDQWIIEVSGPPPSVGRWEAHKLKTTRPGKAWRWSAREQKGPFWTEKRSWVFFGAKPEFSWRTCRWTFIGAHPALVLFDGGNTIGVRFEIDKGNLRIKRDSDAAKQAFQEIKRTIDLDSSKLENDSNSRSARPNRPELVMFEKDEEIAPSWNNHLENEKPLPQKRAGSVDLPGEEPDAYQRLARRHHVEILARANENEPWMNVLFRDCFDDFLVFSTQSGFVENNDLEMLFKMYGGEECTECKAKVRVAECVCNADGHHIVTAAFAQQDVLKRLVDAVVVRQKDVENFLSAAKGLP